MPSLSKHIEIQYLQIIVAANLIALQNFKLFMINVYPLLQPHVIKQIILNRDSERVL